MPPPIKHPVNIKYTDMLTIDLGAMVSVLPQSSELVTKVMQAPCPLPAKSLAGETTLDKIGYLESLGIWGFIAPNMSYGLLSLSSVEQVHDVLRL